MPHEMLVGILAGDNDRSGSFYGNISLFKAIQRHLTEQNSSSFVFTPSGMKEKSIVGYIYEPNENRWLKKKFLYPDVVYNRYPFRDTVQKTDFVFRSLNKKNIPYFNRHFFNKWDVITCLQKNKHLLPVIPESQLAASKQDFYTFFEKYPSVYLKPVGQSQGKGIIKITAESKHNYIIKTVNSIKNESSLENIWKEIKHILNEPYMMQQEIVSDQINSQKYDLRILVHYSQNQYVISGIGVRASKNITTHVVHGGTILPFSFVKNRVDTKKLETICHEIGSTLSQCFQFIGEFSIDAGIDTKGNIFIYEVNSKPMVFDEKDIFQNGIVQLSKLFHHLAKNRIDSKKLDKNGCTSHKFL